jgi:hypothetical protein
MLRRFESSRTSEEVLTRRQPNRRHRHKAGSYSPVVGLAAVLYVQHKSAQ